MLEGDTARHVQSGAERQRCYDGREGAVREPRKVSLFHDRHPLLAGSAWTGQHGIDDRVRRAVQRQHYNIKGVYTWEVAVDSNRTLSHVFCQAHELLAGTTVPD